MTPVFAQIVPPWLSSNSATRVSCRSTLVVFDTYAPQIGWTSGQSPRDSTLWRRRRTSGKS